MDPRIRILSWIRNTACEYVSRIIIRVWFTSHSNLSDPVSNGGRLDMICREETFGYVPYSLKIGFIFTQSAYKMKPTAGDHEEKLFQLNTKTIIFTHTQCLHPVTRHPWIGLRIAMCPGGPISRSFHVSFFPPSSKTLKMFVMHVLCVCQISDSTFQSECPQLYSFVVVKRTVSRFSFNTLR
jgi:hypothetical protein